MQDTHYHILNVPFEASSEDIKTSYRKLAKEFHPDRNPGQPHIEEHFKKITQAYITLSDPEKKEAYDWQLYRKYAVKTPTTKDQPKYSPPGGNYAKRKRPYARPNPFYRSTPYVYSRQVRKQGAIFVSLLILFAIGFPVSLEIISSERYYQEGMDYYGKGNYFAAVNSFELAFRDIGFRNADASMMAAKIMVYKYSDYSYALRYINLGLRYADQEQEKADFLYLRGLCLKNEKMYSQALSDFDSSKSLNPSDSSLFQIAELNAFIFKDYNKAIIIFDQIPHKSEQYAQAQFGKGYCHYHLHQYQSAVEDFQHYIDLKESEGLPYYFKGLSELKLDQQQFACEDLKMASDLGIEQAESFIEKACSDEEVEVELEDLEPLDQ